MIKHETEQNSDYELYDHWPNTVIFWHLINRKSNLKNPASKKSIIQDTVVCEEKKVQFSSLKLLYFFFSDN